MADLKRTALYDAHAGAGASFTPFAGYDMPVHYGSIKEEHHAVRTGVGLFDVSHMGNLWLSGSAIDALGQITPSDPNAVADGRCKYTVLLRPDGTILDDTIYGRYGDKVHLVPNAGMHREVADALQAAGADGQDIMDVTDATAIIAVQGPKAPELLEGLDLAIKPFAMRRASWDGAEIGVSGTGYTGEKGAELMLAAPDAPRLWQALLSGGSDLGVRPIGLGARDTLRLEKGFCLAGNEFAGGRTPLEAGLQWVIDWDHEHPAREPLLAQKEKGDYPRLRGLLLERGIPRPTQQVLAARQRIGSITSGTQSPTLRQGIALGYLEGASLGDTVDVMVRDRAMPATVVKPPFV